MRRRDFLAGIAAMPAVTIMSAPVVVGIGMEICGVTLPAVAWRVARCDEIIWIDTTRDYIFKD